MTNSIATKRPAGAPMKQRQSRTGTTRMTICIPADCREYLEKESERSGVTMASIISSVLREKMTAQL